MPGLLMVKSNEQMNAEQAEERDNLASDLPEPITGQLVGKINAAWSRNKQARTRIDKELLTCMRQRSGEYDPEELALIRESGGGNTIFMMIAATKCNAAASWLQDVLLPSDDLPVGAEATPIPELPGEVMAELVQRVQQQIAEETQQQAQQQMAQGQQQGQQPQQASQGQPQATADERIKEIEGDIKRRVNDRAKERAEGMTDRLHDVAEEAGLRKALEDYIEDFTTYPTAILKGPIYRKRPKITWGPNWQPEVAEELVSEVERVSPFDCYPSPEAETCDDGEFIERMRMTRKQLHGMRDRPGYDTAAIDRVLRDEASGSLSGWIWTDNERNRLEHKDDMQWITPTGVIDALHYWGHASGMMLMQWGMKPTGMEALKEYDVEAILIGSECVRCVINADPFGRRPYQASSFRRAPRAFGGEPRPDPRPDPIPRAAVLPKAMTVHWGGA